MPRNSVPHARHEKESPQQVYYAIAYDPLTAETKDMTSSCLTRTETAFWVSPSRARQAPRGSTGDLGSSSRRSLRGPAGIRSRPGRVSSEDDKATSLKPDHYLM